MQPLDPKNVDGFLADAQKAAELINSIIKADGFIHCFSHLDADGIAAAGVIGKALYRQDARFRMRITQWVDEKIITEITPKTRLCILPTLEAATSTC
jgi:single-stranded DNA-specific DHH superfamily exonuclease